MYRFRGVVAPASLKHIRGWYCYIARIVFPGRCCPGLIEASTSGLDAASLPRGFRGVVAPASLKPTATAITRYRGR